jgi:hypothetical protein
MAATDEERSGEPLVSSGGEVVITNNARENLRMIAVHGRGLEHLLAEAPLGVGLLAAEGRGGSLHESRKRNTARTRR